MIRALQPSTFSTHGRGRFALSDSWLRHLLLRVLVMFAICLPQGATASPDVAAADRLAVGPTDPPMHLQDRQVRDMPMLGPELAKFHPSKFLEDRQKLTQALDSLRDGLSSAIRPTPAEIDLLLDLAALHLAQRMLPEARSFLDAVPDAQEGVEGGGAPIIASQAAKRKALVAAVDGFTMASTPPPRNWDDAPLFAVLHHISNGDHAMARPLLPKAVIIIESYPPALAENVLPLLLGSAIDGGAWDVARHLAAQLKEREYRNHSAAYRHLLGRAAQAGGDLVAAFDNHAAAAAGHDIWAQRSRLALIDLGRTTGTLPPEDARQLLHQTRNIWSGGALGLATLQRLAGLELSERRDLPALQVLGEIIRLHPETREAEAAAVQADLLMERLYSNAFSEAVTLEDLVATHRAVGRDYSFHKDFDLYAEKVADQMATSGASGLAATEFEAIRARLDTKETVTGESEQPEPEASGTAATLQLSRDRLRLKHAAALMQGGRATDAETVLGNAPPSADKVLRDQEALLRARIYAAMDRPADVMTTWMTEPSDEYLRLRAEAAFKLSDWEAARETYERLLRRVGNAMLAGDRINLLLAAHRGGEPERVRELLVAFPDLETHWAALAAGLTSESPEVLPLRGDAARRRVESADSALRSLRMVEGQDMP